MPLLQDIINSNFHYQPIWVMILITLSVILIGYLFSAFSGRFNEVIRSFFTMRYATQLAREEHSLTHPVSILLSINYLLACSLFILQLLSFKNIFSLQIDFSFVSLLAICAVIVLINLVKIVSIKLVAFIFDKPQLAGEYVFTVFLVNQMVGIALIPVVIFIAYGAPSWMNVFIYMGILLLISGFCIRIGKGLLSAISGRAVTLFYLFLYLCTLEIIPLLVGFKLLENLV